VPWTARNGPFRTLRARADIRFRAYERPPWRSIISSQRSLPTDRAPWRLPPIARHPGFTNRRLDRRHDCSNKSGVIRGDGAPPVIPRKVCGMRSRRPRRGRMPSWILRFVATQDVGRGIRRSYVEGQIQGGVTQVTPPCRCVVEGPDPLFARRGGALTIACGRIAAHPEKSARPGRPRRPFVSEGLSHD
jgi:hypothetical protein